MSEAVKGMLAVMASYTIWGLSPIYYKLVDHVPALEVLAHRTIWTLVMFAIVLAIQGRLGVLRAALSNGPQLGFVALASGLISLNWLLFIFAIQSGQTVQASIGYYIFPLIAVLFGVFFFKEHLNAVRGLSVAIAAGAVLVLSVGLGSAPWLSLALAVSFALYGVVKKKVAAGPVVSVTAEVVLVAPLALVWLVGAATQGWSGMAGVQGGLFGASLSDTLLLPLSGLLTGVPLMLFAYASKRITLTTIGLGQYYNSSMQFAVAVLVFGEVVTRWHAIALPAIWLALAIYFYDVVRQERAVRRASVNAGTSSTTVT
ncbi:EamA family transporter RarD [Actibacterium lipolyticum]|uniref:EamA-like transporter family protein n=1 Tax=Actibacterium lipolyticum TaxID=1524263 RepID=A0A238JWA2_9RHOB|nr:EamA family transporter RarD [Actibacterium lipolyticum]SMX34444.1 EamA-like transporter family protein [Actibacterium lipolyticum]